MKIRYAIYLGLAVLLLSASPSRAQGRFEISPFVGYETGASYPVNVFSSPAPVDRLRVNPSLAFGSFVDYNITENSQIDFMWNRNNTSYSAQSILTNQYHKAFDSTIDQFQFGFLYTFLNSEHRLRPYIVGSVGFTHDSNGSGTPNRTEFAYSLGGGVKYYVNRHFGLRGDVRYLPTYGSSTPGTYCDPYYGYCYTASLPNYLNRGSFVGGMIFRF